MGLVLVVVILKVLVVGIKKDKVSIRYFKDLYVVVFIGIFEVV